MNPDIGGWWPLPNIPRARFLREGFDPCALEITCGLLTIDFVTTFSEM
jgi:hypothetical protein